MDYLTDIEKDKIIAFNQDPILVEAVRKVLLESIYSNGTLRKGYKSDPLKNGALGLAFKVLQGASISNEQLGEDLRGYAEGVQLLEIGLDQLGKIKSKVESVESPFNEAI